MTLFLCILSFIAGVEARKPCIAFCMRSVHRMNKRMLKYMLENNELEKKLKEKHGHQITK